MIFLQSRKRRQSLERFFSFSKPTERGCVLIDDDDDSYEGMSLPAGWGFHQAPRASVVIILNRAFQAYPNEPYYAQIGDDYVCQPEGWDKVLGDACGSHNIAWGDDGRFGPKLCTSFFVGGDLVRKLGFIAHPSFGHLYVDTVWWSIAKGAGIGRYHPEISTKHLKLIDKTYHERTVQGDYETFNKLREKELSELINIAVSLK